MFALWLVGIRWSCPLCSCDGTTRLPLAAMRECVRLKGVSVLLRTWEVSTRT